MTDPKPRPWFRFHLSTCIVMMFVAGALVGANVTPNFPLSFYPGLPLRQQDTKWGWPLHAYEEYVASKDPLHGYAEYGVSEDDYDQVATEIITLPGVEPPPQRFITVSSWDGDFALPIDILANLAILAAVGFALERRIRRREK